ncbi:sodium:calcium antiporter [Salinirubellus sp. GCM10025818]|uniref:sodium:calcium antiporter n=1 Tax=Salinirubellus TaxID=2162630 RepID=UPI0030D3E4B7
MLPVQIPPLLSLAVSLAVLVWASGVAVDRLVKLAQRFDVPDVLVAVTVISLGTSLPEIGTHLSASAGILAGELDYGVASATVMGGNLGSSIAQQLLLFGVFVLAYGGFTLTPTLRRDYYVPMLLAAVLLLGVSFDGTVGRLDALALLGAYGAYTYWSFERRPRTMNVPDTASEDVVRDTAVSLAAMGVVLAAAFVALAAVEELVADLALGGSMAGVVTIGLASALPELSTVLESVRRKAPNVAVGTLVGSNVVNPLVAVGLGGVVSTYRVPPAVVWWDLPFKLLAGIAFLAWVTYNGGRVGRRDGTALVVGYFLYVVGRLLLYPAQ